MLVHGKKAAMADDPYPARETWGPANPFSSTLELPNQLYRGQGLLLGIAGSAARQASTRREEMWSERRQTNTPF